MHNLRQLAVFLAPYKLKLLLAAVALVFAASGMLLLGQGLRLVVDRGFASSDPHWLNLDAASEQKVQLALDKLMLNRTSLVIAHRLSTIVSADRILLVDKGDLVASGTHEELLESSALYLQLAKLQFRD